MLEFFQGGGPFMWPLGLWSVLSIAFFLERVYTYATMRSEDELAEITTDINSRIDSGTSVDQLKEFGSVSLRAKFMAKDLSVLSIYSVSSVR